MIAVRRPVRAATVREPCPRSLTVAARVIVPLERRRRVHLLTDNSATGRSGRPSRRKAMKHGGMGVVFQAEDTHPRRVVALKVMRPELGHDAVARERFMREARSTAAVRSDHIVAIHEVGIVRGLPYLATEFLHGKTLEVCLQT